MPIKVDGGTQNALKMWILGRIFRCKTPRDPAQKLLCKSDVVYSVNTPTYGIEKYSTCNAVQNSTSPWYPPGMFG